MTWVIGASPFAGGYGAMLSDIQVKLSDGTLIDVLQKAYPVGNYIVAGFAGSVCIGFKLLQSLENSLALPASMAASGGFRPAEAARAWAPIAKQIFDRAPVTERVLGSQFLIVGVDPVEDDFVPGRARVYLCRFASPDFRPGISKRRLSVLSIGSGSKVRAYRLGLRELLRPSNTGIIQLDFRNGPGFPSGLNHGVSMMLQDSPQPGVSPHTHLHVVSREGFQVGTNNRRYFDGITADFSMPPVAQTWKQFCAMVGQTGKQMAGAKC